MQSLASKCRPLTAGRTFWKIKYFIVGIVMGACITCLLLFSLQRKTNGLGAHRQTHDVDDAQVSSEPTTAKTSQSSHVTGPPITSFKSEYQHLKTELNNSLYFFDRPGRLIPLMRLSEAEKQRENRVAVGRGWLKSQTVVVGATVRNAMAGLPSSVKNLQRLRAMFKASWLIFVENESTDGTRSFLYNWTRSDHTVILLGCDTVNSPNPCRLNIRYSSGKAHEPGVKMKRTFLEEVERGLIMSALRNQYLSYVYDHFLNNASLLLMIDPDVTWIDWDLDNIAQGLYYFMAKPKLQQLCAHSTLNTHIYDPCTLAFHLNKHYGEDTNYPVVDYYKSLRNAPANLPPVKVESCFQAFAFYRVSDLSKHRMRYSRSPGEWMCEHNTLSRQLQEVYFDPQMRLQIRASNVG